VDLLDPKAQVVPQDPVALVELIQQYLDLLDPAVPADLVEVILPSLDLADLLDLVELNILGKVLGLHQLFIT
jgi:hypothetical protein